ncbi:ECF transporter S component [Leuconostoc fallax]|uniref:Riboflavin transporter n=1 Tax=Leuconostoc fallax TaxID=1251 RepID=A0A4R5N8K9_9LACO|nr:ECF transporter S component [Leuconostoc fallax]MBU7455470.1 ECF transporter S component [Leuconostoc fallax]TDG68283.1 hypothetical protein C5L23_000589 [Leuconostoc fallax]
MSISRTRTQRITFIAIMSTISFLLMIFPQIPLIPGADFLKLDFSIIPVLLAVYWFDFSAGLLVILLRTILKLLLNNEGVNTYLGLPVNVLGVLTFITLLYLILPRVTVKLNYIRAILGVLVATGGLAISMIIVNWFVVIPLYAQFAHFDIQQIFGVGHYLIAIVMPFNLIQGIIWGIVSMTILSSTMKVKHIINR